MLTLSRPEIGERDLLTINYTSGTTSRPNSKDGKRLEPIVASFLAYAHRCDWRVAILGAAEQRIVDHRRVQILRQAAGDLADVQAAAAGDDVGGLVVADGDRKSVV